ncbi:MAG TPA: sulfatase [Thermoanaerobaculia bacterium]|jgi:arylsulfatase A-like enzyme|nr:sulfatase [Thermoanaerobaculia bacterium]
MLDSPAVRPRVAVLVVPAVLVVLVLSACRQQASPQSAGAWDRLDLWRLKPEVESTPTEWRKATLREISYLGAEEVRDLRLVPAKQLIAFPKRTAGQVEALQQRASSRVRWTIQPGREAYFSFIPLGTTNGCVCTYRVGVREGAEKLSELYRVEAEPVGPIAPAAVEVDLSPFAGRRVDLLLQIDGPAAHAPDQPVPSVLWGSPAVYSRKARPTPALDGKPNILVIGFDTLRADALGAWGRNPSLTPSLDQLAEQSDVWLDAYSSFNVTNPSFISIFTGLYGKNHGVYDLRTPLPRSHVTLARLLAAAGYDTLALISASHLGDHNSGLGQGFAEVHTATEHYAAELPVDLTMDWLAARAGKPRPFFVWLHLFDPHTPHTPPQPYALGFRPAAAAGLSPVHAWTAFRQPEPRGFAEPVLGGNRDLYDGEVAYLDRQVGRLLDFLASRGLLENTVVAVVSDHGENLGEHGIRFRHVGLFDTTTHVPLMIRWPGRESAGRRIAGLVQTIDLFPTLLAAAGLQTPKQDGTDLRELTGEGRQGRRAVFSEHAGRLGLSVRTRDYRYGLNQEGDRFLPVGPYLYDLKADPGETQNLAGRGLVVERELNNLLLRWLADRRRNPNPQSRDLTEEEERRLRALGYG